MLKALFIISALNLFVINVFSTHLIGGSLTYRYLGNDSYEVNLSLYADPGLCVIPSPVQPGPTVVIEYYNGIGDYLFSAIANKISTTLIAPYQGSCIANDSCYYSKKVIYRDTINLPTIAGGYHLYHETCCRSGSIQNIFNPNTSGPGGGGEGFYAKIPDRSIYGNNSSPEWKKDPPTFYCINTNVNFNNGAYDVDGDSLVYSFYQPFSDINYTSPNDLTFISSVPQFSEVAFLPPYHSENVLNLNGTDSLIVDLYGHVHGVPDNLGYFVAGIKCEEFRNGILLSTIYRDLRYVVINCPQMPLADFISQVDCSGGGTVQFQNVGIGDSYFWDFDTSNISNDTSTLMSPSFTYTTGQCYDVALTATNNNGCISEEIYPVCVGNTNANFSFPNPVCDTSLINIVNLSSFPYGSNINFIWTTSQNDTSYVYHPSFNFPNGNTDISLIVNNTNGCSDTLTQTIQVDLCSGIHEEIDNNLVIYYPNPVKDFLNFKSVSGSINEIDFYDILGQKIKNIVINSDFIYVEVLKLDSGLYYFTVTFDNGKSYSNKFIKE